MLLIILVNTKANNLSQGEIRYFYSPFINFPTLSLLLNPSLPYDIFKTKRSLSTTVN